MYFVDLTEELKQEIINKYTVHKIKKVDLRKEYGYSQKICQKIFKDIPNNRLFDYDSCNNANIIWDKLFNKEYEKELYYWMGFCMADGSIDTTNYNTYTTSTLSLCLANKDIDRIKAYSYFWTNNDNIHLIKTNGYKTEHGEKQSTSCFKFSITKYEENFKNFGLIKNKTYNFQEPIINDKNNMINYLRGWFDGDGCVYIKKNKERVQITGMREQVEWYLKKLLYLGYNGTFTIENPIKTSLVIQLRINGKNNIKIFYNILKPKEGEQFMSRKWDRLKILLDS
jgi:hypothetical protein